MEIRWIGMVMLAVVSSHGYVLILPTNATSKFAKTGVENAKTGIFGFHDRSFEEGEPNGGTGGGEGHDFFLWDPGMRGGSSRRYESRLAGDDPVVQEAFKKVSTADAARISGRSKRGVSKAGLISYAERTGDDLILHGHKVMAEHKTRERLDMEGARRSVFLVCFSIMGFCVICTGFTVRKLCSME